MTAALSRYTYHKSVKASNTMPPLPESITKLALNEPATRTLGKWKRKFTLTICAQNLRLLHTLQILVKRFKADLELIQWIQNFVVKFSVKMEHSNHILTCWSLCFICSGSDGEPVSTARVSVFLPPPPPGCTAVLGRIRRWVSGQSRAQCWSVSLETFPFLWWYLASVILCKQ